MYERNKWHGKSNYILCRRFLQRCMVLVAMVKDILSKLVDASEVFLHALVLLSHLVITRAFPTFIHRPACLAGIEERDLFSLLSHGCLFPRN